MEIKNSKLKLQKEVDSLNRKYCKNTKNELQIHETENGFQVILSGKKDKRSKTKLLKGSLGSKAVFVTYGHHPSQTTIQYLKEQDKRGSVLGIIKSYERR